MIILYIDSQVDIGNPPESEYMEAEKGGRRMKPVYIHEKKVNAAGGLFSRRNNIFGGGYNVRYSNPVEIIFSAFFLLL